MRGGRASEPESKAPELYSKEGLHMSKSEEGGGAVFTADQKHLDTSRDVSKRVCVRAHQHVRERLLTRVTDILVSSVSLGQGG